MKVREYLNANMRVFLDCLNIKLEYVYFYDVNNQKTYWCKRNALGTNEAVQEILDSKIHNWSIENGHLTINYRG